MSLAEKIQKDLVDACAPKDELGSASAGNQGPPSSTRKSKNTRPRRRRVHPNSANPRKTAQESIEQSPRQPPELAGQRNKELAIIESYLPAGASEAEMDAAIGQSISESGANSIKQMGAVVKQLRAALEAKRLMQGAKRPRTRPSFEAG